MLILEEASLIVVATAGVGGVLTICTKSKQQQEQKSGIADQTCIGRLSNDGNQNSKQNI